MAGRTEWQVVRGRVNVGTGDGGLMLIDVMKGMARSEYKRSPILGGL